MTKIIRIKGKRVRPGQILLAIGMILVAMIMIAPFLWVFSASLRTFSDATALPPKWLPPALGEWNMKYFDKLCSGQIPFFYFYAEQSENQHNHHCWNGMPWCTGRLCLCPSLL